MAFLGQGLHRQRISNIALNVLPRSGEFIKSQKWSSRHEKR